MSGSNYATFTIVSADGEHFTNAKAGEAVLHSITSNIHLGVGTSNNPSTAFVTPTLFHASNLSACNITGPTIDGIASALSTANDANLWTSNALSNALPKTGGTVTGDLVVQGSLSANSNLTVSSNVFQIAPFRFWPPALNPSGSNTIASVCVLNSAALGGALKVAISGPRVALSATFCPGMSMSNGVWYKIAADEYNVFEATVLMPRMVVRRSSGNLEIGVAREGGYMFRPGQSNMHAAVEWTTPINVVPTSSNTSAASYVMDSNAYNDLAYFTASNLSESLRAINSNTLYTTANIETTGTFSGPTITSMSNYMYSTLAPMTSTALSNAASSSLPLTGGTITGDLTVNSNLDVNGDSRITGTLAFGPADTDPTPTITARTVPTGQGSGSQRTELILFHANDNDNGAGIDTITMRAPGIRFQTYNDSNVSDISNSNGANDRMVISPAGNVGIGTSNPQALLDINGNLTVRSIINPTAYSDLLIWDDQDINTTFTGTLTSNATRDTTNKYIRLNPVQADTNGVVSWQLNPGKSWTLNFDHWAGGGTGADATAITFFSSGAGSEDSYRVLLDEWNGQWSPDAVKLFYSSNQLASWTLPDNYLINSTWKNVTVQYHNQRFAIALNDDYLFTYTDTVTRPNLYTPNGYIAFRGYSGGYTNEHRVRNIRLVKSAGPMWMYANTASASDMAYLGGNVGIGLSNPETQLHVMGPEFAKRFPLGTNLSALGYTASVSSGSNATLGDANRLFDGNSSTTWLSQEQGYANGAQPTNTGPQTSNITGSSNIFGQWAQLAFPHPVRLTGYEIYPSSNLSVSSWTMLGSSNSGASWGTVDVRNDITITANTYNYFATGNGALQPLGTYNMYRWIVRKQTGTANATGCAELGFFGFEDVLKVGTGSNSVVVNNMGWTSIGRNNPRVPLDVGGDVMISGYLTASNINPNAFNPVLVWDNQNSNIPFNGSLAGSATRDTTNGYIQLNPNTANSTGSVSWQINPGKCFTLSFDMFSGGGTGAEGMTAQWFATSASGGGGYQLFFNEWNGWTTNPDYAAFSYNGSEFGTWSTGKLDDSTWRNVFIRYNNGHITICVNNVVVYTVNDNTLSRANATNPLTYVVFTGFASGSVTNSHRIRNVRLVQAAEGSWQFTNISGTSDINYTGGNVGIGTSNPQTALAVKPTSNCPEFAINPNAYNTLLIWDDQSSNTPFYGKTFNNATRRTVEKDIVLTLALNNQNGEVSWPVNPGNAWKLMFDYFSGGGTGGQGAGVRFFCTSEGLSGGYEVLFNENEGIVGNSNDSIKLSFNGTELTTWDLGANNYLDNVTWKQITIQYYHGTIHVNINNGEKAFTYADPVARAAAVTNPNAHFGFFAWTTTINANHVIRNVRLSKLSEGMWSFVSMSNSTDITYTAGRVGIGKSNPQSTLDVNGLIRSSAGLMVRNDGSYMSIDAADLARLGMIKKSGFNPVIACTSNIRMSFGALNSTTLADVAVSNFVEHMAIQGDNGNVGIGTSNPGSIVHIRRDASNALGPILNIVNAGGWGGTTAIDMSATNFSGPGTANASCLRLACLDNNFSADFAVSTKVPGALGNALVERMRVTSEGRLGIGISNPSVPLEVNGETRINGRLTTTVVNTGIQNFTMCPTMSNTSNLAMSLGKATTNNNIANFRYVHQGDGASSNYLGLGFWGKDDILNVAATGRVGIGTSNPSVPLEVIGDARIAGGVTTVATGQGVAHMALCPSLANGNILSLSVGKSNTANNLANFRYKHQGDGADSNYVGLGFWLNDEILNVVANGRVGVGTATPTTKLDVNGAMRSKGLQIDSDDCFFSVDFTNFARMGMIKKNGQAPAFACTSNLQMRFGALGSTTLADVGACNFVEHMTLTGDTGRLGIGTTSPEYRLDVSGDARITGTLAFGPPTGDPAPTITTRTVPAGQGSANERTELILFHANDMDVNQTTTDTITLRAPGLRFQTYNDTSVNNIANSNGANDRMYISSTGNVGINTIKPETHLDINGNLTVRSNINVKAINPVLIWDDQNSNTTATGTLTGSATRDTANQYIQLNPGYRTSGTAYWQVNPGKSWTLTFDHWAGGGTGADYTSVEWYATGSGGGGGYRLELNEFNGALTNNDAINFSYDGTSFASWNVGNNTIDNSTWRNVSIRYDNGTITIMFGSSFSQTIVDTTVRSSVTNPLTYLVFAGFSGDLYNTHRIRNVRLTVPLEVNGQTQINGNMQILADNSFLAIDGANSCRYGLIKKGGMGGALACTSNTDMAFGALNSTTLKDVGNSSFTTHMTLKGATGRLGIGTTDPTTSLHVNGTITATSVTQTSDARMKQDIQAIPDALSKIRMLKGYTFMRSNADNDVDDINSKLVPRHAGLLAQEVEAVHPEVVYKDADGFMSVSYANMVGLLVQAINELADKLN